MISLSSAKRSGLPGKPYKVKIAKLWDGCEFKVGDIVECDQYGTFGGYDKKGRWVDFYSVEIIKYSSLRYSVFMWFVILASFMAGYLLFKIMQQL